MSSFKSRRSNLRGPRSVGPAVLALGISVGLVAAAGDTRAESNAQQKAVAEALFDEANKLMDEGQFSAACERFDQSEKADPGVGTLLYLARCYARTGRLASSWAIYREAASAARASGQGDRARTAEDDARDLRPRLSELAVMVPPGQPRGFEVLMDGELVSAVQFGLSVPVDAGQHTLVARAPGFEPWSTTIQIGGNASRQTVQVGSLRPLSVDVSSGPPAAPTPGVPFAAAGYTATQPAANSDGGATGMNTQKVAGLLVGGGGLVLLGAGVTFGLHAKSMDDDAKKVCVAAGCYDPMGAEMNRSARHWALAANILYGLGGGALATGGLLYFTAEGARSKESETGHWQVAPTLGDGPGVLINGRF